MAVYYECCELVTAILKELRRSLAAAMKALFVTTSLYHLVKSGAILSRG